MCHQLIVTGFDALALLDEPELVLDLLLSLPPHAATTSATAARSPTAERLNFTIA
jgi:hypothetical protein